MRDKTEKDLYVDNEITGFRKRYLIYLCILAAIFIIAMASLWIKMSSYQKSVDAESAKEVNIESSEVSVEDSEQAAQKVFTSYVDSMTLDGWVSLYYECHPEHFDAQADVENFINEKILNANASRFKASDYTAEEPKYLIAADSEALAGFTLAGSGLDWEIASSRIFPAGSESALITAPADCSVLINGASLTEDNAQTEKTTVAVDGYDDDLTNPVIMNTYTISNLISAEADVSADNAYLSDDGSFYEMTADDGGYADKAVSFIKSLLHYYASGKENTDANSSEVLSHVRSGSGASSIINSAKSGLEWVTPNYSVSYEVECSPLLKAADNCFFADVSYTPEGAESETDETDDSDDGGEADQTGDETSDGELSEEESVARKVEKSVKGSGVYRVYFLDDGNGYGIVLFEGIR